MKQLDNTTFDRPIPGMSMTHELGARPWQTPPTYATVEEAADYYIERMANPDFKDQLIDIMEMKVPLTTLANTIQLGSVMEGIHTVDVGMLVLPMIMEMLMMIGDSAGVKYETGLENPNKPILRDSAMAKAITEYEADLKNKDEVTETEDKEVEENEEPTGLMARRK